MPISKSPITVREVLGTSGPDFFDYTRYLPFDLGVADESFGLEGNDQFFVSLGRNGDFVSAGPGDDSISLSSGAPNNAIGGFAAIGRVNGDEGLDRVSFWSSEPISARQLTPRTTLLTRSSFVPSQGRFNKSFFVIDDTVEGVTVWSSGPTRDYRVRTLVDGPLTNSPTYTFWSDLEVDRNWYSRQEFPALRNRYDALSLNPASIQLLYVAYYGRPSDPDGAAFWTNAVSRSGFTYAPRRGDGLTSSEKPLYDRIVIDFGNSIESDRLFAGLSTSEAVDTVYNFCFNRNSEKDIVTGENYWVGKINRREITLSQAAVEIALGAQAQDLVILGNKIKSADAFVASLDTPSEVSTFAGPLANRIAQSWLGDYGPYVATLAEGQRLNDLLADISLYQ